MASRLTIAEQRALFIQCSAAISCAPIKEPAPLPRNIGRMALRDYGLFDNQNTTAAADNSELFETLNPGSGILTFTFAEPKYSDSTKPARILAPMTPVKLWESLSLCLFAITNAS
jgi:hypothetical protein